MTTHVLGRLDYSSRDIYKKLFLQLSQEPVSTQKQAKVWPSHSKTMKMDKIYLDLL
jgi:hypothetical protein